MTHDPLVATAVAFVHFAALAVLAFCAVWAFRMRNEPPLTESMGRAARGWLRFMDGKATPSDLNTEVVLAVLCGACHYVVVWPTAIAILVGLASEAVGVAVHLGYL